MRDRKIASLIFLSLFFCLLSFCPMAETTINVDKKKGCSLRITPFRE